MTLEQLQKDMISAMNKSSVIVLPFGYCRNYDKKVIRKKNEKTSQDSYDNREY